MTSLNKIGLMIALSFILSISNISCTDNSHRMEIPRSENIAQIQIIIHSGQTDASDPKTLMQTINDADEIQKVVDVIENLDFKKYLTITKGTIDPRYTVYFYDKKKVLITIYIANEKIWAVRNIDDEESETFFSFSSDQSKQEILETLNIVTL